MIDLRGVDAAWSFAHAGGAGRSPEQSHRLVPVATTCSMRWRPVRLERAALDSSTRCLPIICSRAPAPRSPAVPPAREPAVFPPWRALEVRRPAAGQAGMDRRPGARGAGCRGASQTRVICDTYLSSRLRCRSPRRAPRRGADVRRQIWIASRQVRRCCGRSRARNPSVEVLHADSGWSAVVRVPSTRPEDDLVLALLERDGVLVHPGFFFDFAHEAFLVVSLLPRARFSPPSTDGIPRRNGCDAADRGLEEGRRFSPGRHAGPPLPLFSMPSRGAGESARFPTCRRPRPWLQRRPVSTSSCCCRSTRWPTVQSSPYPALSAMAIDPLFIAVAEID